MNNTQPVIVSYGGGRDSTALLIEMVRRQWRPDAILFANVGSEKRATYDFMPVFDSWLRRHDFPGITEVKYTPVRAPYETLEGNMIKNATLPGAAFNKHSCAMKFKVEPQQKWTRRWRPAQEAWARGEKVLKLIGFEAGETYRMKRADARAHSGKADKTEAKRFEFRMPLMEWGYDLARCIEIITSAGLPVPPKSACYFCPFQKTHEVDEATPEDRSRTMLIEITAEPYNQQVRGLWRQGSVTEYILDRKLDFVPLTEIAPVVVLNEKCQKARTGQTFRGPHLGPTLRSQLEQAGHQVPEVVLESSARAQYEESRRTWEPASSFETERHLDLVEAL
jgi:3'-phosphoadenosine 5'-phosphosulfate sulfotransferase (PAPS reductase)/FAD synthetase